MRKRMFFGTRNGLFLLWHNRWFSKPLTDAEVDTYLAKLQADDNEKETADTDEASFHAFRRDWRRIQGFSGSRDAAHYLFFSLPTAITHPNEMSPSGK